MNYSPRINKLRHLSLNATNRISSERAKLVTLFYKNNAHLQLSTPVMRALCLKHIFTNKTLYFEPGELIVGERGEAPKAVSTYPEVCLHSLDDLKILHNREKVNFMITSEVVEDYKSLIIPYWTGHTHRDRMLSAMSDDWMEAYRAGIFTEFQEQRAPGHTVLGKKMWGLGMKDLIAQIDYELSQLDDYNDKNSLLKREELKAMQIAAEALILYAKRYQTLLEEIASNTEDQELKNEILNCAEVCGKVPANAPTTFHEALQHYWFIHLAVITELNPWDSFNPGHLDQHLLPFYLREKEGVTSEIFTELLSCFWIKFNNHPAPPKVGITALESNTYTDFSLINVGGVKEDGSDAVNEMTYMILDVIKKMRLLQPSSMVQISKKNPDQLIHKALNIIETGFGQPSLFNTDAIVQELMRQGKTPQDARNGGASGCVEAGAFGTEAYILTGYFNLPKILEITLHNGIDPRTQKQIGIETGAPDTFKTFNDFYHAFEKQLKHFIDIKIKGSNIIEQLFSTYLPVPFLSLLIDDCISNGLDYNSGGARYNSNYIQGVGLGTITDSLTAINQLIYQKKKISFSQFISALQTDFNHSDDLRLELIYETPKWGNDQDEADCFAIKVFESFFRSIDGRPSPRGAHYRINLLPTTCHIYFGQVTGATPDGRKAGTPLSEGISPVQGADTHGPSAVIRSMGKIDHIRTGGTLLNQKFAPSFFKSPDSYRHLTALIRSYFRMDGHHIQFNVVDAETLIEARIHPEKHRDLIVRVAGYSDYFNDLGADLQEEIIRRTAHETA